MLSDEEIKEIKKQGEKSEAVKKLFDFYEGCRTNGMKRLFIEMNNKFSSIADNIKDTTFNLKDDDKSFERFMKIAVESGTMQDNYSKMEAYMFGAPEVKEGDEIRPFTDRMADKRRDK